MPCDGDSVPKGCVCGGRGETASDTETKRQKGRESQGERQERREEKERGEEMGKVRRLKLKSDSLLHLTTVKILIMF